LKELTYEMFIHFGWKNDLPNRADLMCHFLIQTDYHISAAAVELLWLPVEARTQYKICVTGPSTPERQSCIIHFKLTTASFHTVYFIRSPEICVKPGPILPWSSPEHAPT